MTGHVRAFAAALLFSLTGFAAVVSPAQAATTPGPCSVAGFAPRDAVEAAALRRGSAGQRIEDLPGGLNLAAAAVWPMRDGARPMIVVDSSTPLDRWHTDLHVLGLVFRLTDYPARASTHNVTQFVTQPLGPWMRRVGLSTSAGPCSVRVVATTDRPFYLTIAGTGGLTAMALGSGLAVVLGRRAKGGWPIRFLSALPVAVLAGLGEAVALQEAGAISPFSTRSWWLPAAGLALAAALPLTRSRARAGHGPDPATPAAATPPERETGDITDGEIAAGSTTTSTIAVDEVTAAGTPQTTPTTATVVPEPATGRARAGRGRRTVNAGLAAGLVVAGVAALALPGSPAAAPVEIITPAQARLVFDSLWTGARQGDTKHLLGAANVFAGGILQSYPDLRTGAPQQVEVGVPSNQYGYPAYFVATAYTKTRVQNNMTLYYFALLIRPAPDRPWSMQEFRVAPAAGSVPHPKLTAGGYLTAVPDATALAFPPSRLAQSYAAWINRSVQARKVVSDPDLVDVAPKGPGGFDPSMMSRLAGESGLQSGQLPTYNVYNAAPKAALAPLIPLTDGTVLASFSVSVHLEEFNNDRPVTRPCTVEFINGRDGVTHYSHFKQDFVIYPVAYIPPRSPGAHARIEDNAQGDTKETGDTC